MLERIIEKFFVPLLLIMFFFIAFAYNVAYFGTLGDSLFYFFYVPFGLFDLIKTGLASSIILFAFLIIFKPFLIDPPFNNRFPDQLILFAVAILVLASNLAYFVIFANSPDKLLSLISELSFYAFITVGFFGILYHFLKGHSRQLLMVIFFCSLIPISLLTGWTNAKIDIKAVSTEARSRILLQSNKVISAKILRSFEKGMFVIIGESNTGINFISWDEIKEVKFRKVSSI